MIQDPDEPHRDYAVHWGLVQDNVDPSGKGRVRITIPGLLEPSMFAQVLMLGSPFSSGAFAVPAVGAQVACMFIHGDLTQPIVIGGVVPPQQTGGFRSQLPVADLPKIETIENEDFVIMLGHRDTDAPYCTIRTRSEPVVAVTIDIANRMVDIKGPSAVKIASDGMIRLEAPVIALGNRTVIQNGKPI
jgi:hypothetical protein